jgi:hypothetical protein
MTPDPPETLEALLPDDSPFQPEEIASPRIVFDLERGPVQFDYLGRADRSVRVSFERWDALRACRGEHSPYPRPEGRSCVFTVEGSTWLRQRHAYESLHYGARYNFGGDVNEMLEEFDHFLFCFHDEFVEVIAGGVRFAEIDGPPAEASPWPKAFAPLPEVVERYDVEGAISELRKDPRPVADLVAESRLRDQVLYQLTLEADGHQTIVQQLTVRTRRGRLLSRWRGYFGVTENTFAGVPELRDLRPLIAERLDQIRRRRIELGRA